MSKETCNICHLATLEQQGLVRRMQVCVCVCVCVCYTYIYAGRPDRGGRVQGSGVSLSSRASALAVRRRRIYAAKAVQKVDAEPRVEEEQGEGFKTGGAGAGIRFSLVHLVYLT